jgi:hypothetical protein
MTTTWGLSYLYASISRILLTATRSYAICPQLKCVLAAARSASGGMTFSGQSATMAFQPLEITQDGTHFYVIGTTGVEKHTMAAVPVFANLFSFDAGLGRFIFSEGSYLVVPSGDGGVQTISRTTGVALASLPGVLSEIHAGCYDTANRRLWLFDQNRAKGVSIQVGTAGQLTYASSFSIPNCKNIVRVVFDSTAALFFIVNDHRIVSFSTAAWDEPAVSVDNGVNELTFTDFAIIGTNQYWIGAAEPSSGDAVSAPLGPQIGAWDASFVEMQIACPKMSIWTVNNAIPYWTISTIGEIAITPPPTVPLPPSYPAYVPPPTPPPVIATTAGFSGVMAGVWAPGSLRVSGSLKVTCVNTVAGNIFGTRIESGGFNSNSKSSSGVRVVRPDGVNEYYNGDVVTGALEFTMSLTGVYLVYWTETPYLAVPTVGTGLIDNTTYSYYVLTAARAIVIATTYYTIQGTGVATNYPLSNRFGVGTTWAVSFDPGIAQVRLASGVTPVYTPGTTGVNGSASLLTSSSFGTVGFQATGTLPPAGTGTVGKYYTVFTSPLSRPIALSGGQLFAPTLNLFA